MNLDKLSTEDLLKEIEKRNQKTLTAPQIKPEVDVLPIVANLEAMVKDITETKFNNEDNAHYLYETVIECFYGKEYWTWLNQITK